MELGQLVSGQKWGHVNYVLTPWKFNIAPENILSPKGK